MNIELLVGKFIQELNRFEYRTESLDFKWDVLFPDAKGKWHHLHVTRYKKTYYVVYMDLAASTVEFTPGQRLQVADSFGKSRSYTVDEKDCSGFDWEWTIRAALRWMAFVERDWIKAARKVAATYPLNRRRGVVPHSVVRECLRDIVGVDKALGLAKTRQVVGLVESGYFMDRANIEVETMTVARYFEYCRIAYLAGRRSDESIDSTMTGREMYQRYADGRDDGLLEIDPDSEEEFAAWIDGVHPRHTCGGHPWEIKRGGNTTHIDLSVFRPPYGVKRGFVIQLRGESLSRMVETLRMFLALVEAKMPISIADPEGVRKRLLAQDNIGLVPRYETLHRANQRFPSGQTVYDVMHYDDLGRSRRRLASFITWDPLPMLKPRMGKGR